MCKKTKYYENVWDLLFFVFFCDALEKTTVPIFNKMVPMEKPAVPEYFASLFSFYLTFCSLQNFSRRIFGLFILNFFIFSKMKCTNLR